MIEILQNIPMNSKLYSPLIGECTIYRLSDTKIIIQNSENPNIKVCLPKGSIKKLIGRELTWDDDAFELKKE